MQWTTLATEASLQALVPLSAFTIPAEVWHISLMLQHQ